MRKVVICGGHLTPALSVIDQLKKHKGIEILFFGRKYATEGAKNFSAEFKIISQENIKFYGITAGRLQRKFTKYTIPALFKTPTGFIQALIHLFILRPNIIVSFGGYLSLPIVISGWLLGIKSVTHEQSSKAGLANKINSLFTEKVFLAWPQSQKDFPEKKTEVIGNPTRKTIFLKKAKNSTLNNFLKKSQRLILVIGGNQGSHFINQKIFDLLPSLSQFNILHQVGTTNFMGDLDRAKKIKMSNYFALDYISAYDIGAALNRADLVVSRSGANTVWDLSLLGKICILIPLPFAAAKEQEENARILERNGSCRVLKQEDTTSSKLKSTIDELLKDLPRAKKRAVNFQKTLPKDAAEKLSNYVLSYT
ncbi:hypothetical protein A3A54_01010 [Candidatus Curtissbacteria bacterium RIFCSPLOWO2_01_FULL_39_62]|uniref:UDP-N-acetylglucosamine--N-acetylmuramyl-(pentapeptide) pyrophosphoryl-undecaprenol N-acetylglucosamine transferase n=2 Tax=Candidatus Curtissiibacteriota TaxID=1752717 RepID=A0A1F5G7W2_9BACT|nr:MAG: hypothetical protein A2775_00370 [Candidatus Curtissbacteria bacterium RIFCSPHIGHO2_01_FULL_39_57]OGD87937.1 MAG: hypothetical protein A3D04_03245 [Candidatus Curtissbacteria bacterium RIFCSPHIGHO2_02_FULL_40_16b]OGE01533.1 MAG: hypothetical protein A3J17_00475 [Candidatus Curtissbacteria bacterium RIFCSPLOWO2_02_FULL_40_11]OGE01858.1 MAG: hypothetical protein A3A54_01010 [Candidatus Curtissbacteria bacterium RIFCSPLOWO2_01_FULL_39_62]OGE13867.1 MAG: hypothetical protein A3G14_01820 [Ca